MSTCEIGAARPDIQRVAEIITWQRKRQDAWRAVPAEGADIAFNGLSFYVLSGVFWPFEDSLPLIENMRIPYGATVLDVGSGAGTIALHAARKGAGHVSAIDRHPDAVRATQRNSERLAKPGQVEAFVSDVFDAVAGQRYDVITANLPWLDRPGRDDVEAAQWDTGYATNRKFFAGLRDHLNPGGRAYYAQGNYGAVTKALELMQEMGLQHRIIGKRRASAAPDLEFYAFELLA